MKKMIIATTLVTLTSLVGLTALAHAGSVTCEENLKKLSDTMAKTKLSPADLKSVNDIVAKATERCVAEDDKRAEGFIADAMKIVTKK